MAIDLTKLNILIEQVINLKYVFRNFCIISMWDSTWNFRIAIVGRLLNLCGPIVLVISDSTNTVII